MLSRRAGADQAFSVNYCAIFAGFRAGNRSRSPLKMQDLSINRLNFQGLDDAQLQNRIQRAAFPPFFPLVGSIAATGAPETARCATFPASMKRVAVHNGVAPISQDEKGAPDIHEVNKCRSL